jgi:hypothetical protein
VTDPQDLYGLPLEQFVSERNALARTLRREGRREQAEEVAKLRKPSVAAWAVNQIVRTQQRDVAKLLDAGDALQQAQAELLAGRGQGARLRQGLERERALVDALTEKARGLLNDRGELAPATLERVSDTLHAAALDADARAQVTGGSLERELRQVGLGTGGLGAAPAAPKRSARSSEDDAKGKPAAERRAEEERAAERRAARRAESQARRAAEKAERGLEAAQRRRDAAAAALRAADEALASARAGAEQAVTEHRRAQRALGDA